MADQFDPKQLNQMFEQLFGAGGPFEKKPNGAGPSPTGGAASGGAGARGKTGTAAASAVGAGGLEILRVRLPLSFRERERGGVHKLRVRWDAQATRVTVRVPPNTRHGAVLRLRGVHVATRAFEVHMQVDDPTFGDRLRRPLFYVPLALLFVALLVLLSRL